METTSNSSSVPTNMVEYLKHAEAAIVKSNMEAKLKANQEDQVRCCAMVLVVYMPDAKLHDNIYQLPEDVRSNLTPLLTL